MLRQMGTSSGDELVSLGCPSTLVVTGSIAPMRATTSPAFDSAFHAWRDLSFPPGETDTDLAYADSMIAGALMTLHDDRSFVEPSPVENWNGLIAQTIEDVIDRWSSLIQANAASDEPNALGLLRYALLLREVWSSFMELKQSVE